MPNVPTVSTYINGPQEEISPINLVLRDSIPMSDGSATQIKPSTARFPGVNGLAKKGDLALL